MEPGKCGHNGHVVSAPAREDIRSDDGSLCSTIANAALSTMRLGASAAVAAPPAVVEFVNESKRLLSVVSPLSVTPLVPRERRFLYAASHDRVADTADQAYHLCKHWERADVLWFGGAHLGVAWSGDVTSFVRHGLATAGLLEDEDE